MNIGDVHKYDMSLFKTISIFNFNCQERRSRTLYRLTWIEQAIRSPGRNFTPYIWTENEISWHNRIKQIRLQRGILADSIGRSWAEDSKQYTAFSFEGKIYEFKRTPFGTQQSSQAFIKALQVVAAWRIAITFLPYPEENS